MYAALFYFADACKYAILHASRDGFAYWLSPVRLRDRLFASQYGRSGAAIFFENTPR